MSTSTLSYKSASEEEEGLLSEGTYPPPPQSAARLLPPYSGQMVPSEGNNTLDDISIRFWFRPKYPLTLLSEAADVMGLLPRSQEEAIQMSVETFPVLQRFEPERFLFFVDSPNSIVGLASLPSSSWKGLRQNPPAFIRVEIADGPEDLEKRRRHERITYWRQKVYIAVAIAAFFATVFLSTSFVLWLIE